MFVELHSQPVGQLHGVLVDFEAHRQHHHVEGLALLGAGFVGVAQLQVAFAGRIDGVHPGADEPYPVFLGAVVVLLEFFAVGAHVHVEDSGVQLLVGMLLGDDRLFDGVHAAHGRAVRIVAGVDIARADALQPGDLARFFAVVGAHQVTPVGSRGAQDTLEFEAGYDIGKVQVIVGIELGRVEHVVARSQDHRSHLQLVAPLLVVVMDGFGQADFFAQPAADTHIAVDGEAPGDRLGIAHGSRFPQVQSLVEFIHRTGRADLPALTAGGAGRQIDEPRLALDRDREVAGFAFQRLDLGVGNDIDIEMAPHFDQFRRNDTHGAVVGRKRLVQLRHDAADGRRLVDQVDVVAGAGQIQRRLHPRDSGPDD